MNLLEFAVQRKLEHEDQLLDYVAKHKAVPVDVLSTALADIIGPLEDRRASLLVENYTEMLSEYVPMTYKRDAQTGPYTVGGEIDEAILDSISLVHDIDAESAISDMIEENIRVLTNTQAEVHGLNMGELERVATQLNTQTIQTVSDDKVLVDSPDESVGQDISDEGANQSTLEDAPVEESAIEDVVEEALQETPESTVEEMAEAVAETAMVDEDEDVTETADLDEEETVQEAVDKVVTETADLDEEETAKESAMTEEATDEAVTEAVDESAPEVMTEEDEEQVVANKMKRIYIRLVEDIKAAGLDKSLGLAL